MLKIPGPGANEHGVAWGLRAAVVGGTILVPGAHEQTVHHLDTRPFENDGNARGSGTHGERAPRGVTV